MAGTAWATIHMLQHHSSSVEEPTAAEVWRRFQSTSGNMLHALSDHPARLGLFFANYPGVAQCIQHWSGNRSAEPLLLISKVRRPGKSLYLAKVACVMLPALYTSSS